MPCYIGTQMSISKKYKIELTTEEICMAMACISQSADELKKTLTDEDKKMFSIEAKRLEHLADTVWNQFNLELATDLDQNLTHLLNSRSQATLKVCEPMAKVEKQNLKH
jgi:hypothetical protein